MNEELTLDAKIEALLFYKGEPVSFRELSSLFKVSSEDVSNAILILEDKLGDHGLSLVKNEKEVMIGTNPSLSHFFEELRKEELTKELSRASLETLSIILYKQKVTRADIDYIRGVNSSFILRNLRVRGLIDRVEEAKSSFYIPTLDLLSYLGVQNVSELPDFEAVAKALENKIENLNENEQ